MEHLQKTPHAIGDLQGCCSPLQTLLAALPANAPLRFVGDLINRGPESLATLRQVIFARPAVHAPSWATTTSTYWP